MAEKPILFSAEMVRAILAGRKTQTRRLVKPRPACMQPGGTIKPSPSDVGMFIVENWEKQGRAFLDFGRRDDIRSPYAPGDTLWVREQLARPGWAGDPWLYAADLQPVMVEKADQTEMLVWAQHKQQDYCPSIHMPRWASRITLRVTGVRVERVRDISDEDVQAEGITYEQAMAFADEGSPDYSMAFRELWHTIHAADGPNGWAANPWVWVIEFEREGA